MRKPMVALVGRPNVGKSTLFNRIIGRRVAVVSEVPGTTRDRIHADAEWAGREFIVVDTGGIEVVAGYHTDPISEDSARFLPMILSQASTAIDAADLVVFLVDAKSGLTAADQEVAEILRRSTKPVIVAANKAESESAQSQSVEFYVLGLGEVIPVSALHGVGTGDLMDKIIEALPQWESEEDEVDTISIAIVGRPNVGKSSLLNAFLGHERSIVSPISGTTRDAIDTEVVYHDRHVTLIDTAGIRRRGKIDRGIEKYSVLRALQAINRADVALLILDAVEGITAQDEHVAGFILEEGTSVVVVANKWDAVQKDSYTMLEYSKTIRHELRFMDYVPLVFTSALTGKRVPQVLETAFEVYDARFQRVNTGQLNRLLRNALASHAPPSRWGRRLKIYYATQAAVDPPTFVLFVNDPKLAHFSYRRYLENVIREQYPFKGTPLVVRYRARDED
ncbi:MAG: ribosome biogenesis GTPase Der [Chloroflexota bacterium]